MSDGSSKPWWESEMDWSLQDTVVGAGQRLLRKLPEALAAYKLGKTAKEEIIEELPIEKISGIVAKPSTPQPITPAAESVRPLPRIVVPPAPPKPAVNAVGSVAQPTVSPVPVPPPLPSPVAAPAAAEPTAVRAVNMDQLGSKPAMHTLSKPTVTSCKPADTPCKPTPAIAKPASSATDPGQSPILSALRSAPKAVLSESTGIKPAAQSKSSTLKTELSNNPLPGHVKDLGEATLTRIREKVEQSGVTLEQLLDPDFRDFS